MFVCYVCCVLSARGLCDELITRPEESYRLWRVVVCDQETSFDEEFIARAGLQLQKNNIINLFNDTAAVAGLTWYIVIRKSMPKKNLKRSKKKKLKIP
jgi:hypothetical protein